MSNKIKKSISDHTINFTERNYVKRINRVIDFIDNNIEDDLTLTSISEVANYSEYHFHRIFKSYLKEPLGKYIQRIRAEKAAAHLIKNPDKSVTQIAYDNGFSSSQFFSRIFKQNFGMSPREWRENKNVEVIISEGVNELNRNTKADMSELQTGSGDNGSLFLNAEVEIKELQDISVAYIRHIGSYSESEITYKRIFSRLLNWARSRGYIDSGTRLLIIYNDFFGITKKQKQRAMLCVTVPHDAKVNREIIKTTIPGGKYAVGHFELTEDKIVTAWNFMLCEWLKESSYQLDNRDAYSCVINYPCEEQSNTIIFDIFLPVKPL